MSDADPQLQSNGSNPPEVVEAAFTLQQQIRSKLIIHAASRIQRLWRQYRHEVESTCDPEEGPTATASGAHNTNSIGPTTATVDADRKTTEPVRFETDPTSVSRLEPRLRAVARIEEAWRRYRRALALERQLQREVIWDARERSTGAAESTSNSDSEESEEGRGYPLYEAGGTSIQKPPAAATLPRFPSHRRNSGQPRTATASASAFPASSFTVAGSSAASSLPLQLSHEDLEQMLDEREVELETDGLLRMIDGDESDSEEGEGGENSVVEQHGSLPVHRSSSVRSVSRSASASVPRPTDTATATKYARESALVRATAAVLIQRALRERLARSQTQQEVNRSDALSPSSNATATTAPPNKGLTGSHTKTLEGNNDNDAPQEAAINDPALPESLENALRILQNRFRFGRLRRNLRARDLEDAARTVQELWRRRRTIADHYDEVARGRRESAAREIQNAFRRRRHLSIQRTNSGDRLDEPPQVRNHQPGASLSHAEPVVNSADAGNASTVRTVQPVASMSIEPQVGALPLCVVCMSAVVQVALLPCGHAHLCGECASCVNRCPACRKRIALQIRIFL